MGLLLYAPLRFQETSDAPILRQIQLSSTGHGMDSDSKQEHPTTTELELVDRQDASATKSGSLSCETDGDSSSVPSAEYKLYKWRFAGCVGISLLNGVTSMGWPWFGPIANNMAAEFGITLDQVNWLGNITSCVFLPMAPLIPIYCSRYGIRRCCDVGVVLLLLSAWIRYAGTSRSLSVNGAYALLMVGQFFVSISTAIFQVLVPKYSENWFGLKGRTTATMVMSISFPIGGAVGQLISPLVGDTRRSILVLGIISTAVIPAVFLIRSAPPTPPTYAGSHKSPSLSSLLRAMLGKEASALTQMTVHERIDFVILTISFAVFVAIMSNFAILSAQILSPVGYSAGISGIMGAVMLLAGIVAAIVTAPLFDRILTHHLAITTKIIVPIVAVAWLSLIWAVRPHNTAGLFAIMTILGVCSITLLPVALELGCELTRNADGSSAFLWFFANLLGIVFLLAESALRAGPNANPPLNMRRTLIFNGVIVMTCAVLVFFLRGRMARKELDELKIQAQEVMGMRNKEPPPTTGTNEKMTV